MSDILIPSTVITLSDYTVDVRVIFDKVSIAGSYHTTLPIGTLFFSKLFINYFDVTENAIYTASNQQVSYSGGIYNPVVGDQVVLCYCVECPLTLMPEGRPPMQTYCVAPNPLPATLNPGAWNSGVILGGGYKKITVSLETSEPCALFVQRFVDMQGRVAEPNDPQQLAITANQVAVLNIMDSIPFGSFSITVNNTSGLPAQTSNFYVLLND
jgi:hypothetical protein